MRAYVDESVRVAAPGLYVLAGVVVRPGQAEPVRDVLRRELRHQRRPFHWRLEERTDRESMAKRVGALDLSAVVAVASPVDAHRPERARRFCLTRMLWELEQRQVLDVLLESRTHLDSEDRAHILGAQKAGHLTRELRYAFERPNLEPLLWLPDLVAGAVSYSRAGLDQQCLEHLQHIVTVVDVGGAT